LNGRHQLNAVGCIGKGFKGLIYVGLTWDILDIYIFGYIIRKICCV
jgi:hypothetical protein